MKQKNLGKDNINGLLLAFAIPCIISMLINSVYNIVDQIFIGKGVGTLGNAATNVIFPLFIMFNAIAGLIGNGAAANLSLKLGEGKKEEVKKCIGNSITIMILVAIIISVISYLFLPKLIIAFGCTNNVYKYAIDYGRIILIGAPFMIIYSALSSIIRADGSPKYSMFILVVGAIINIILDPIMIFGFNLGVKGGALATIIGQFVSLNLALCYIPKINSVKLSKKDFIPNKNIFKILALGLSSFITQMTILVLFVFMNNMLTKLGANSKFGEDIPLSVYGVISKVNSLFISSVLGISIGAQPIIGFNYGARNFDRVKQVLKKVLKINFLIAFIFNICFFIFPKQIISIFISNNDPNYKLFVEFAILFCRSFMCVITLNALEMTTSIVIQSLGKVFKSTMVSFIRQILLLIPFSIILSYGFKYGIYGTLYAGPIADFICFIICIFIFSSEYKKLSNINNDNYNISKKENNNYKGKHIVITISREYGSGGRYVGKKLSEKLGINFYDKEIIEMTAKESGLSKSYIEEKDQNGTTKYNNSNEDKIFIYEEKVIKKIANESCVIIGRCADYILRNNKNIINIFLYTSDNDKEKRAVKYYGLDKSKALKQIKKINKQREKHYNYYTNRKWKDFNNYDLAINVDKIGIDGTVDLIIERINKEM